MRERAVTSAAAAHLTERIRHANTEWDEEFQHLTREEWRTRPKKKSHSSLAHFLAFINFPSLTYSFFFFLLLSHQISSANVRLKGAVGMASEFNAAFFYDKTLQKNNEKKSYNISPESYRDMFAFPRKMPPSNAAEKTFALS